MGGLIRVAIIGAGVVGASISRVLSMFEDFEVHLIEKEADVGWGVSKANTGIIHAGYDDEPDLFPLRAKLCAEGNLIWHEWVKDLDIPIRWCGSLVLAFNSEGEKILEELLDRGIRNGVPSLEIIDREKLKMLEPSSSKNATAALWAPTAGQISPWDAVAALVENSIANGVKLHLSTEVRGIKIVEGRISGLETNKSFLEVDCVINAAGLYADKISEMAGVGGYYIKPKKGEYLIFDKDAEPKVSRIIFPTPTPISKGVVVTTTTDGNLMIGPNAQDLPQNLREDKSNTYDGLKFIWESASNLVNKLPPRNKVIRFFAGLRPEPSGGDFIIRDYDEVFGFIEASGMRSPGLTSAPAVAQMILDALKAKFDLNPKLKAGWNRYRRRIKRFSEMTFEERIKAVNENPGYGRIICVDELVAEAEIVEAIRRGATTIDGIKFRTRACMGTCQGSSCTYKVAVILARELNVPLWSVSLKGPGTEIGIGDVKALFKEKNKLEGENQG
ncbi:NAD(P)/FAD-dependent oxidoreductase [Candidatus Bathyarchaeota archaeon]|nr:NAD(P)/FAD-dependent oxidoreductase [Candidatus Bathyarchaeota archaeon]